jgi:hypothetical protein
MPVCELAEKCIFFNDKIANMPATAMVYKKLFCQEDNSQCARYLVYSAKGKEAVPSSLFPNELDRAQSIIGQ